MPLGVVTEDQMKKELEDPGLPKKNPIIINTPTSGRGSSDNVPGEVRKFIAEASLTGIPNNELANLMGVSHQSVSAYKNGTTSLATYNEKKPELVNHLNRAKERITRKARKVLTNSLDSLTEEKLQHVKAKDAASIARNMAAIIKDMETDVVNHIEDNRSVQIVMFAPAIRQEKHYDAIDVVSLDGD